MALTIEHKFIFAALAYGSARIAHTMLVDRMTEIILDGGPYFSCAKTIAKEWRESKVEADKHIVVKKTYGGKVRGEADVFCDELIAVLDEVDGLMTNAMEKKMSGGFERLLYLALPNYPVEGFLENAEGKKVKEHCDAAAAKLQDLRARFLKMLPEQMQTDAPGN